LAENILEAIPSEPVLRIVESFQTAPAAPLLPAGMPFQEPSARKAVLTRPNITVRNAQEQADSRQAGTVDVCAERPIAAR